MGIAFKGKLKNISIRDLQKPHLEYILDYSSRIYGMKTKRGVFSNKRRKVP